MEIGIKKRKMNILFFGNGANPELDSGCQDKSALIIFSNSFAEYVSFATFLEFIPNLMRD